MANSNLIEILILARDLASDALNRAGDEIETAGEKLIKVGIELTTATAALSAGIFMATSAAVMFDATMTNTASILGQTREEIAEMSQEVLALGARSTVGGQATAEAFYGIVSGVQDTSTHMAILEASIATAEAGMASLTVTTDGLVAVMNAYRFTAEEAGMVSDVFTRTVQLGVGSMDQFVATMSPLSGLMGSAGVSFQEFGAGLAFMTTQGFQVAEAGTSMRAAVVALLTPNTYMKDLLREMGVASGEALLKQRGLTGALQDLNRATGGSQQALAQVLGSVEALNAGLAFGAPTVETFFENYTNGLQGATEASREIQLTSVAAQLDLLKSAFGGVSTQIGQAFLPVITTVVSILQPLLLRVSEFISENQQLVSVVAGLVATFATVGPMLIGAGSAIQMINTVVGVLTSTMSPLIIAGMLIGAIFISNFGGIRDILMESLFPVIAELGNLVFEVFGVLSPLIMAFGELFADVFGGIIEIIKPFLDLLLFVIRMVTSLVRLLTGDLAGSMESFNKAFGRPTPGGPPRPTYGPGGAMSANLPTMLSTAAPAFATGGGMAGGGLPFVLPGGGTGVTYQNLDTQYRANLAQLGVGGQTAGANNNYNLQVQVGETQLLSREEARSNGGSLGSAILQELRSNGSIGQL